MKKEWGILITTLALALAPVAMKADTPRRLPLPTLNTRAAAVMLKADEPAPTLSELDALKLDKVVLAFEKTAAQLQALQMTFQQQQVEVQTRLKALEKPGYTLGRTEQGAWVYQPVKKDGATKK